MLARGTRNGAIFRQFPGTATVERGAFNRSVSTTTSAVTIERSVGHGQSPIRRRLPQTDRAVCPLLCGQSSESDLG